MKGVIDSFEELKGLPLARWRVVGCAQDLEVFGFPMYLKADISGHKSEMGAVVRCDSLEDALARLKKMHKNFGKSRIVVQESFEGIEMIVGLKSDEVFGKVLLLGFGGIFAEVKKDVAFRALPVTRKDVRGMVLELEGFDVFSARGGRYDLEKFYTLVEKVAWLGEKRGVLEMDLNPVVVGEKKSLIVDARVEV